VPSIDALFDQVAGFLHDGWQQAAHVLEPAMETVLHPLEAANMARTAAGLARELAHIGLLAEDPPTCLKHSLTGVRRVAWGSPLPFSEVHTLAQAFGCTVNDVLMSTLAGALGRYLELRGHTHLASMKLHAAVPVNMRAACDSQVALGNRFGLVFVELPIAIRDPLKRLAEMHRTLQELKKSPQALLTMSLLSAVGSLPAAVEQSALAVLSDKASLVASNVPGPRERLHLAGVPISQLLFWVPQAGRIGTGVSMLTYQEHVHFGIVSDRNVIPDPGVIVQLLEREFESLVLMTLLGYGALADERAGNATGMKGRRHAKSATRHRPVP
jgi:WS/DGAT/MGAT family acyltransferase